MAPDAELVLVRSDLNDAHVINGLQYIFRVAAELGRPAVANLSIDSAPGPWDGSDLLCTQINELSGPGRIVCCAAGNRGRQRVHAQVTLAPGRESAVPFILSPGFHEVDIWVAYLRPNRIAAAIQFEDTAPSTFILSDGAGEQMLLPGVSILFSEAATGSDLQRFRVRLSNNAAKKAGRWCLLLRGATTIDTRVDIWLGGKRIDGEKMTGDDLSFAAHVDDGAKIAKAGAAVSAITVASYITRRRWKDFSGMIQERGMPLHAISPSSSSGPLVGGAFKPNFAAPGGWIISALAADAPRENGTQIDQAYAVRDGTSMATAFMSGVAALLLERDPSLDPDGVKRLLRAVSQIPDQPDGAFDPRWGAGFPDISRL